MKSKYDDQQFDEVQSNASDSDSSLAILEPDCDEPECDAPQEPAEWTGPRCEKCSAPMKSDVVTICRGCGWYANLGTFVEVDPAWETAHTDAEPAEAAPQPSHLQVWLNLLPRWAWIIIASVAAIVVESVVVRVATPAEIGGLRTMWSFAQLVMGLLGFALCHIFNFLILVSDDSDVGMLDVVLKPVKLWMRTARELPTRLWLVNTAACSLTAATMSILVIGALPYERLWDWGFKAPAKQDLMGAVMDRAKKLDNGSGADNLEDAIGDFAGSQDLEEGGLPKAQPAKPREKTDCVILGYQLDGDGRLYMLVLGTGHRGELVYAGKVKPELGDEEAVDLLEKLSVIETPQPFLPLPNVSATWVEPEYACRVSYTEKSKSGRLQELKWESMLSALNGL